jgi:hypothetical protein
MSEVRLIMLCSYQVVPGAYLFLYNWFGHVCMYLGVWSTVVGEKLDMIQSYMSYVQALLYSVWNISEVASSSRSDVDRYVIITVFYSMLF